MKGNLTATCFLFAAAHCRRAKAKQKRGSISRTACALVSFVREVLQPVLRYDAFIGSWNVCDARRCVGNT
jgi:hypothetical protein